MDIKELIKQNNYIKTEKAILKDVKGKYDRLNPEYIGLQNRYDKLRNNFDHLQVRFNKSQLDVNVLEREVSGLRVVLAKVEKLSGGLEKE